MIKTLSGNKRNKTQIEADRLFIFDCRIKGKTYMEIKSLIKEDPNRPYSLSHVQIIDDYKVALQEYKLNHIDEIDNQIAKHIATYEKTIAICFKKLQQLEQPLKQVKQKLNNDIIISKEQTAKEVVGGAEFIAQIHKALNQIEQLLGMKKPLEVKLQTIDNLTIDEIAQLKQIQDNLGTRAST